MNRDMMVHVTPFEVHVAVLEDDTLAEYHVERKKDRSVVGNIYKGRVGKVLPGMQSAFVDIGIEKNAFLYVADFFEEFSELKETLDDGGETRFPAPVRRAAPVEEPPETAEESASTGETEAPALTAGAAPAADTPAFGSSEDRPLTGEELPLPAAPEPAEERTGRRRRRSSRQRSSRSRVADAPAVSPETGLVPPLEPPGEAAAGAEPVVSGKVRKPRREHDAVAAFQIEQEAEQSLAIREEPVTITLPVSDPPVPFTTDRRPHGKGGGRRRWRKGFSQAAENEPANIASMLKQGQEILVQVMKEPMALKSARITSHISIPGRTLVYLPTVNHVGVSRKIHSDQERKRLRSIILSGLKERSGGFIIRTASEGISEQDLLQDLDYLTRTWQTIQERNAVEKAPSLLYEELDLVQRLLRDKLDDSFANIWVDDETEYAGILGIVERLMPRFLPKVKLYSKNVPIFEFFNLDPEIEKATRQKVWLKSGGFIVINHTEALIAIDVNTGKYVGRGSNFEETITKINTDAAREIVRQIRLRNLGGIIVMDFIDMQEKKGKRQVMDLLMMELKKDKAPSNVLSFNDFGMVIMTRKRTSSALEKNLSEPCPACGGSGLTPSLSTVCYEIYSSAERMRASFTGKHIVIRANPEVVRVLKGEERDVIEAVTRLIKRDAVLIADPSLPVQTFDIADER